MEAKTSADRKEKTYTNTKFKNSSNPECVKIVRKRHVELGRVELIELNFDNTSDIVITLYLTTSDPDLKFVNFYAEHDFLRGTKQLPLLEQTSLVQFDAQLNSIKMMNKGRFKIPLKYQCFTWPNDVDIKSTLHKQIEVTFLTPNRVVLYALTLKISLTVPRPCEEIIIFKDMFTRLRRYVVVPRVPFLNENELVMTPFCTFHCTDPNFQVMHLVTYKYSPKSTVIIEDKNGTDLIHNQFFVFVFPNNPIFRVKPAQVWCVKIVTPLSIKVWVVLGTVQGFNLEFRGDDRARVVESGIRNCDFIYVPTERFAVTPNEINALPITVAGRQLGSSVHAIQLADVIDGTVTYAWTLYVDCIVPDNYFPDRVNYNRAGNCNDDFVHNPAQSLFNLTPDVEQGMTRGL